MAEVVREKGYLATLITVIAVALALYHLYTSVAGTPPAILHRGIHLFTVLILIFLISSSQKRSRWYHGLNIVLCVAALSVLAFIVYDYEDLPWRTYSPTTLDLVLGGITIIITLEARRRAVGTPIAGWLLFSL